MSQRQCERTLQTSLNKSTTVHAIETATSPLEKHGLCERIGIKFMLINLKMWACQRFKKEVGCAFRWEM